MGAFGSEDCCCPGARSGREVLQGLRFPSPSSLFAIEKAWCYYLADDTSMMIGWCGSFLVNAQIKRLSYCIVINRYLWFLNLRPFTFLKDFSGHCGLCAFQGGDLGLFFIQCGICTLIVSLAFLGGTLALLGV